VSLAMTKQEREDFLADLHVGIISITEEGRGPLTVPIWYSYAPGGEVRVVTGRTTRKVQLLGRARRFSLCAQTETWPYKYVSVEGPIVAIEPANLNAIAGRSLTVTSAFEQVTSTSRGREQRQMRTCLFVCVPSGGSRWTTGRYDRPSPEQLQWTGCVGPSVRTVCSASPTPWTRVGRRDDEPPRRPLDWYVANEAGYSGDVGGHPPPPDGDEPRGRRGPVGPLEQTHVSRRGRLAGESCVRLGR